MSYNTILLEQSDASATLTLNRPDRMNAVTQEMHGELRDALKQVRSDKSIRCLVITGAGRAFCSGQDLSERVFPEDDAPDLGESLQKRYNPLVRSLRALEMPVICAVNGVAAGAGCNLALAADIVLAARSARFIQSGGKLGLVPDAGGTWLLPRLVGRARATGLAMLAEPLGAEQAEAWGMIWQCVDDDQLMKEADQLAKHLSTQPTRGLALIRRAMDASTGNTLEQQLDLERDLQRIAGRTADYREGVTAFMEKREPEYKGE